MRYGLFIIGLVALAAPAQAESRLAYVTMVLQAFAAKVECPGTDVVYQDLVQKAQEMQLPDEHDREGAQGHRLHAHRRQDGRAAGRPADVGSGPRDEVDGSRPEARRHDGVVREQKARLAGFIRTRN
jgi:hypothetical protein